MSNRKLSIITKFSEEMDYVKGIVVYPPVEDSNQIGLAQDLSTVHMPDLDNPLEVPFGEDIKLYVHGRNLGDTTEDEAETDTEPETGPLDLEHFTLRLHSKDNFELYIKKREKEWIISPSGEVLDTRLFIIPRLPDKVNNLFVRLFLLPVELGYKAVRTFLEIILMIINSLRNAGDPETTNVQIGDDGDG